MAEAAAAATGLRPRGDTRELLQLAGPILVSQLAVMGLAVIDTVMAGRLSAHDLAAVALGMSIYASVFIGMNGVLLALTPVAGHHFGAGRLHEIGLDLGQGLWLAAAMSALGMPLLLFPEPWLRLAGVEPAVAPIAARYLELLAFGLPASLVARAYIAVNSAVSRPQVAMAINLAMLLAKAPLNYLAMHGAGPLPALGGAGCALASTVLLWASALANWLVWRLDPFYDRFRARGQGLLPALHLPDWARQREFLKLGLPAGGSLLIEVTSFTLIAVLVARLGSVVLGGHQIIANLVSLMFMLPLSLGMATSVLVAQALGSGDARLARRVALRGWRLALAVGAASSAVVWLLREAVVAAYTTDAAVAALALSLMLVAMVFHLFDAMQAAAGSVLRGYKVAFLPMLIHGASLWGVGLLGGYVIAYHTALGDRLGGALSFWVAAVAGLALTAIALSVLAERIARAALRR